MAHPTPGPYELYSEGRTIVVGDVATHTDLAEFFYDAEHTVPTTRDEALANANQFMAASALLEALRGMVELYRGSSDLELKRLEREGRISLAEMNRVIVARAVIARAESKS